MRPGTRGRDLITFNAMWQNRSLTLLRPRRYQNTLVVLNWDSSSQQEAANAWRSTSRGHKSRSTRHLLDNFLRCLCLSPVGILLALMGKIRWLYKGYSSVTFAHSTTCLLCELLFYKFVFCIFRKAKYHVVCVGIVAMTHADPEEA